MRRVAVLLATGFGLGYLPIAPATWASAATCMALVFVLPRLELPAFAAQTGEPCQKCHVGGFGPQLTAFGRDFKLRGYTLGDDKFNLPLSAMAVPTVRCQAP